MARIKFICCDVFARLAYAAAASSPHTVDLELLPMLSHTEPAKLRALLQSHIDRIDPDLYERLILGYGLCGNAVAGLTVPVTTVMPRTHDCCALFAGSRERFTDIFGSNLSMRWCTCGYHERCYDTGLQNEYVSYHTNPEYIKLLEDYGEDNAEYVWHTLHPSLETKEAVYMEIENFEYNDTKARFTEQITQMNGAVRVETGDTSWFFRLVNGPWDTDNFLEIPRGYTIEPVYDLTEVVRAIPESKVSRV